MSPVMINRSLAGEWVCPGDGVGMSGGLVYLGGYPRSHDMPPPKHVTKEYPSAPVLTPTGSPQTHVVGKRVVKHPTGMLLVGIFNLSLKLELRAAQNKGNYQHHL